MRRRKSSLKKVGKGDQNKFDRYREAFTRIKLARSEGFHLEAITIEESILSDRMLSLFAYLGAIDNRNPEGKDRKGISDLVIFFEQLLKQNREIRTKEDSNLKGRLKEFIKKRNICVHAMVFQSSKLGTKANSKPVKDIDEFLALAEATSKDGVALCNDFITWCRKIDERGFIWKEDFTKLQKNRSVHQSLDGQRDLW